MVTEIMTSPWLLTNFLSSVFFIELDPALCHLSIPFFDLPVQDIIKIGIAPDHEEEMISAVVIGIEGEVGDQMLKDIQQKQHEDGGNIHSCANRQSQSGCQPDSGGGGQTFDTAAHFKNNTCT